MQTVWIEDYKLSAGAAAGGVAVVTSLLRFDQLDAYLTAALYCFSYSIPVNAFLFQAHDAKFILKSGIRSYAIIGAYGSALLSFWAGMVFTVAHLSECAGLIFGMTTFLAILLLSFFNESKSEESGNSDQEAAATGAQQGDPADPPAAASQRPPCG